MMNCPGCGSAMQIQRYEGVPIDHCPACGGTWLDDKEINQIVTSHDATFDEETKKVAVSTRGSDAQKGKVACPHCGDELETLNYLFNSGVFIDRCRKGHGVYLDKGELEKLQIVVEEFQNRRSPKGNPMGQSAGKKLCPRDNRELTIQNYEGVEVDSCPDCGGVWCDGEELVQIVQTQIKVFGQGDHAHIVANESAKKVAKEPDLLMTLPCPVCRGLMRRVNYQYSSGIIIDRCTQGHGVWLDRDELEQVQVFAERWSDQSSELTRKYQSALNQVAHQAAHSYEQNVAAGIQKGTEASLFARLVKFVSRS